MLQLMAAINLCLRHVAVHKNAAQNRNRNRGAGALGPNEINT